MVWADEHHWAKLSFELSPAKQPTLVTVVTRGLSDDCHSVAISGNTVYLQIAKSGSAYVFYFSSDGKHWQVLRVFNLGDDLKPRVGFESQSPAGAERKSFSPRSITAQRKSRTFTTTKPSKDI
jgi:uncharacterized protein